MALCIIIFWWSKVNFCTGQLTQLWKAVKTLQNFLEVREYYSVWKIALFSNTVLSVFFLKATLYTLEFLCFQVEPNKDWLAIPRFVQCIILLPALHYECLLITWHHQFWNWRPSWPRPYIITLLTTEYIQLFLCFKTIFNPLRNSVSFRRCLVPISSQHKSHGNKSLARCIWHSFVFLQNPCFVQKFNFDTFLYFS